MRQFQTPLQPQVRTIQASTLRKFYEVGNRKYEGDYPEVLNPSVLLGTVANMVRKLSENNHPINNIILYIIDEETNPRADPSLAEYVITITANVDPQDQMYGSYLPRGYAIRLFYAATSELESVSTIEESSVIWSPDNMKNSRHPRRTKCYMGFVYMLCEQSPGFDKKPLPDTELTFENLLDLGLSEGEIPANMIEISIGEQTIERQAQPEISLDELQDVEQVAEPIETAAQQQNYNTENDGKYSIKREIEDDIASTGEDDTEIAIPVDRETWQMLNDTDDEEEEEELVTEFEELFE